MVLTQSDASAPFPRGRPIRKAFSQTQTHPIDRSQPASIQRRGESNVSTEHRPLAARRKRETPGNSERYSIVRSKNHHDLWN